MRLNLREITAVMGEGLYVMDEKGRITFTNHEAQVLLGWTEEELIDQDAHQLFHFKKANNEPHPSEDCEIRKVVSSGQTYRSEEEVFWRRDGSRLDVAVCSRPLVREGKVVCSVATFRDITERKKAEITLKAAKDYVDNLINAANAMVVELDVKGNVKVFNPAAEMVTGYTLAELKGRNWFEIIVPRDRYPEVWEMFERLPAGELLQHFENPILTKSGEERHILWQNSEVRENDQIVGLVTFGIDITERKRAEEALRDQKEFLNAILESEPECVKVMSADGNLLRMNRAGLAMLEVDSIEEAPNEGLISFILPEYRDAFSALSGRVFRGEPGVLEFPIKGARGTLRWLETHSTPLRDAKGGVVASVSVARDITERKKAEAQIHQLAYYDFLTHLPNRRLLLDRLKQSLVQAKRYQRSVAVMFLDLDRFKLINDTLGHDVGDELLKAVATRLNACVRSGDTVARQGGDEFIIVLAEVAQPPDAALVAEKISGTLRQPISVNGHELQITTSIGISLFPVNGTDDAQELMKKADTAMYAAKEAGRNGYQFC